MSPQNKKQDKSIMAYGFSKSRYTTFRACDKALWLNTFKPEVAVIDSNTQARFAAGTEVGELARGLFGPFEDMTVRKEDGHLDYKAMIAKTQDAIEHGVANICEAAFSYNGNYCAVDILRKVKGGYSINEVKSSTHPENEVYAWDVAYQEYVLTGCGLKVKGTNLICIDNSYVRHGELELDKLFMVTDISDAVDAELPFIEDNLEDARQVLDGSEPGVDISPECDYPYQCAFWNYCTRHLPKPSVFDLYRMNKQKKFQLYNDGKYGYDNLDGIRLTKIQKMQVAGALDGEIHIDKKGVQSFLDTLSYPLYYLDFETIQPAIPLYDGTKPYQQITTQYSLHVQEAACGELKHFEFLAPSREAPMRSLAEALCRDIPTDVCVLAYNKGFECTRIAELAVMFPDLADHLLAIRDNIKDLLVPFQAGCYYLPSMKGSFSIKSVLPALFPNDPELDYHALDDLCQNGGDAMALYPQLRNMTPEEEARARKALLTYCCLDTLAMVKVLSKLYEAVK